MSTGVMPFAFEDRLFRAVTIGDAWWFIAGDVAEMLGYRHVPSMVRLLDGDEVHVHKAHTSAGSRDVSIISEPGLYRAILARRGSKALAPEVRALIERFQRWIFHDLLPTLRRTGRYDMPGAAPSRPAVAGDGPTREREHNLERVKVAMRLWGVGPARRLWVETGEPDFTSSLPAAARRGPDEISPAARLVADAIVAMVEQPAFQGGWTGSAATLLTILHEVAGPLTRRATWPGTAQKLGRALDQADALLVEHGIRVDRRHSKVRTVTIVTGLATL